MLLCKHYKITMIKDLFPGYFGVTLDKNEDYWTEEFNFDVKESHEGMVEHFQCDLELAKGDYLLMMRIGTALVGDLLKLKVTHKRFLVEWDFHQFIVSACILEFVTNNTLFGYSFDWIANSLSEEISTGKQREISSSRLHEFGISKCPFIKTNFFQYFFPWVKNLFYYSRCTGGHNELCLYFIDSVFPQFIHFAKLFLYKESCLALCQISSWCTDNDLRDKEKVCNNSLYANYFQTEDHEAKKIVALFFSGAKLNQTDISKSQWLEILQTEFSNDLNPLEKLQICLYAYSGNIELLRNNFQQVIDEIKAYANHYDGEFSIYDNHHANRMFTLFERMIATLLYHAEEAMVTQIFGAYFNVEPDKLITSPITFIIPNSHNGVVYSTRKRVYINDSNSLIHIPAITEKENNFLGTRHALLGKLNFKFEMPDRPGVPDKLLAPDYFNALYAHFKIHELKFYPEFANTTGIYLLYGAQMPMQPMLALELGKAFPWIHTFQEPLEYTQVKKVFIWQGYTQMSEIERMGVTEIFEKFRVEVTYLVASEATKEEFLQHYANVDYDVFWILGHGEILSDEMHLSYLDFGDDITVSIDDLKKVYYKSQKRRLLFMDTCDSATTGLQNNPSALGLGVSVLSNCQSVFGHSWPVENIGSLIHGLLLATFLGQGHTYEECYSDTIKLFHAGKEAVLEHLSNFITDAEVLDRIRNTTITFQNFFYWGSLTYMI